MTPTLQAKKDARWIAIEDMPWLTLRRALASYLAAYIGPYRAFPRQRNLAVGLGVRGGEPIKSARSHGWIQFSLKIAMS